MPLIFILAAIMDPRMKLVNVDVLLRGISENLSITLPSAEDVRQILTTVFTSYEAKFGTTRVNTAAAIVSENRGRSWNRISLAGSSSTTSRSELNKYLENDYLTSADLQTFDILAWWKKNETTFPVLSIMARDLLTPPASSVASESAFSAGKRILNDKRTRLAPEILDCLSCLKDWEDARLDLQQCHPREEFRDYFEDSDIDDD